MRTVALLLVGLVPLLCGCSKSTPAGSSSTNIYIEISKPKEGWAESVRYETGNGPYPRLTSDEVCFELRDPASYRLDLELVGIKGVKVTNLKYESTEPAEPGLLHVLGRAVEISDEGALMWGTENLGKVSAGDVVIVDAKGLTISK
ncbi:MAG: hypothetical protein AAF581_18120 [Planctomycetota bacterium]